MAWRDISSAPKDAYIWLGCYHSIRVGFWRSGEEHEFHGTKGGGWADYYKLEQTRRGDLGWKPTHWQPFYFPAPPEQENGK